MYCAGIIWYNKGRNRKTCKAKEGANEKTHQATNRPLFVYHHGTVEYGYGICARGIATTVRESNEYA